MTTKEEVIRRAITDALGDFITKDRVSIPGKNLVTPYFACYVKCGRSGDIAEITFDTDMVPLTTDPIYGLTFKRQANGDPDLRDGGYLSLEELAEVVAKC